MSELKSYKLSPRTSSGTVTLGTSGDTFDVPSGVTFDLTGATVSVLSTWENTPNFYVKTNADQSWSSSYTKFEFNTLVSESDTGSFDNSVNQWRFTVPSGKGGTYLFAHNFGVASGYNWYVKTLKNGTDELWWRQNSLNDGGGNRNMTHIVVAELAAGDYVEWLKYSGSSWTNMGSQLYGVRLHT